MQGSSGEELPQTGGEIVNAATMSSDQAGSTRKRKAWQVFLLWLLERIIEKIGSELFNKYVWPYLTKIATRGWALVVAVITFLKCLLCGLFHAKAAASGGAATTTGIKMIVMTCCKCAAAGVAA
jgi:hypothetical protein